MTVTDADLARARQDQAFRRRLLTDSLELLLRELNRLRSTAPDDIRDHQLREGVDLAVKLATELQSPPGPADPGGLTGHTGRAAP